MNKHRKFNENELELRSEVWVAPKGDAIQLAQPIINYIRNNCPVDGILRVGVNFFHYGKSYWKNETFNELKMIFEHPDLQKIIINSGIKLIIAKSTGEDIQASLFNAELKLVY